MHAAQKRVEGVVVVVDLDAGLVRQGAGDATDVLDDPATPRDREGQEQGVEGGQVEAFAETLSVHVMALVVASFARFRRTGRSRLGRFSRPVFRHGR